MPGESSLLFLKLGGSLITDKMRPHFLRDETLQRLANEISTSYKTNPGLRLIIGHGSGSFGHVPAKRWGTRLGVKNREEWKGFIEVWTEANALNQYVMQALASVDLPAISFSPLSSVTSQDGKVLRWETTPIQAALTNGLVPVIHGDVVFDLARGGTILSTEDLFDHLARKFRPKRILLAGLEAGVWADFPSCTRLIPDIYPSNRQEWEAALGGSTGTDVTGGMASKVMQSLKLAEDIPNLEILIFSGEQDGNLERALNGALVGTRIKFVGNSPALK